MNTALVRLRQIIITSLFISIGVTGIASAVHAAPLFESGDGTSTLVSRLQIFVEDTLHKEVEGKRIPWSGSTSVESTKKSDASTEKNQPTSARTAAPSAAAAQGPNLVSNPSFENNGSSASVPANWNKGGYGTNTRTFTYPVTGSGGSNTKAAKVSVSTYSSGDAKWWFPHVAVTPGTTYTYSDTYISDKTTYITIQYKKNDGTFTYQDIGTAAPASAFTSFTKEFTVPAGVSTLTVFHLIKGAGSLTIDDVSLTAAGTVGGGGFSGGVSLRFDDGRISQYQNALPKLQSTGLKGTFYIVTRQISDNGYTGYMSKAQVQDLYAKGHEIGAHTRTHRDLTTLSSTVQQDEISGARQDLQSWNVGPIRSFSYPFGSYNATTLQIVKNAGFETAAATIDGTVTPSSDLYQLERESAESDTSVAQMKQWIDNAMARDELLILTFHSVDTSGSRYSVTPNTFNQVMDYLVQNNIPTMTVSQGIAALQQ